MFEVTVSNGRKFHIVFEVRRKTITNILSKKDPKRPRPTLENHRTDTICRIMDAETGREVWSAMAKLHPNDSYNKFTGKKVALTRALHDRFPKDDRKAIWKAFFTYAAERGLGFVSAA